MKYIKLTGMYGIGESYYVAVDKIEKIVSKERDNYGQKINGSIIIFEGKSAEYAYKESPEEILELIKKAEIL